MHQKENLVAVIHTHNAAGDTVRNIRQASNITCVHFRHCRASESLYTLFRLENGDSRRDTYPDVVSNKIRELEIDEIIKLKNDRGLHTIVICVLGGIDDIKAKKIIGSIREKDQELNIVVLASRITDFLTKGSENLKEGYKHIVTKSHPTISLIDGVDAWASDPTDPNLIVRAIEAAQINRNNLLGR